MSDSLDLDRMAANAGLSREDLVELLGLLFETAETMLATLRHAAAEENMPEAARAAHTLKGGAATVGLTEVAALAHEVETACRAEGLDRLDVRVERLHNCVACARAAFEAAVLPD